MLQIAIAGYTFHGLTDAGLADIFGVLESTRYRYHLNVADIWNGLMGKDPEKYLNPEFLKKLRGALDDRGLSVVNYHADGCHPWESDPAARDRHYSLALRHIEAAEALGAKTVRIDTGGREQTWSNEQFDLIVKRFAEWSKRAASGGYRIGPEVHWGAEVRVENMEKLCKAVGGPGFGVLLHIGRWEDVSPDEGDRRIAPYTMHCHLDSKTLETRVDSALNILLDAGYTGCLSVEDGSVGQEYDRAAKMLGQAKMALSRVMAARAGDQQKKSGPNPLIPAGAQRI